MITRDYCNPRHLRYTFAAMICCRFPLLRKSGLMGGFSAPTFCRVVSPRSKLLYSIQAKRIIVCNLGAFMVFFMMSSYSLSQTESQGGNHPIFKWSKSLPVESFSPNVGTIGGTE